MFKQFEKLIGFGAALVFMSFLIGTAQIQGVPHGPQITAIDFPGHIEPDGQPVSGVVHFEAPKADVAQIEMKVLQALDVNGRDISKTSDIQDASWDPEVKGLSQGEIPFSITTKIEQSVMIAVTLIGSDSGRGPSKQFSWDSLGGMVLIPAGSFQMGDSFNEGDSSELPVHTVNVSAFYMDKNDVTKFLWDQVATWAQKNGNGYDIEPSDGNGKASNHPVENITWYQAVKWANARSEMENLTPVYYTNSSHSTVYRNGNIDLANDDVNWAANGYRLPTEVEWEKAARGGAAGQRFPWSDTNTIDWTRANYTSNPNKHEGGYELYDTNQGSNYNPTYATGGLPYTSPVGSFAANGYGLYDMAGNVWQWVWDWYDGNYYVHSPGSDPHGPASGSYRIDRGGSWYYEAYSCRVAYRGDDLSPGGSNINLGFRLVRTAP